jgi:hypothetical protein
MVVFGITTRTVSAPNYRQLVLLSGPRRLRRMSGGIAGNLVDYEVMAGK